MKVLITGKGSVIGTAVRLFINVNYPTWNVTELDVKGNAWRSFDFSCYDSIYHVAGIAHVSAKKKNEAQYFRVNRDLAIEVAVKAKQQGVKQFIFMSSMIIYGKDKGIGNLTPVNPSEFSPINAYGQSKLDADLAIRKLSDSDFHVSIIRSPVVYGVNAKGNFSTLLRVSSIALVVPKIKNARSMIYIKNLAAFVAALINQRAEGIFYPQNPEYVSTNFIIEKYRFINGKKTYYSTLFAVFVKLLSFMMPQLNKMYGNKYYPLEISFYEGIFYHLYSTESSILDMGSKHE